MNIDIQIERWPIERLIPRANNPRTHSPAQVAQLAASMREFGFSNPILVGADDDVIAGHARLMAARKLGMTEVPVMLALLQEAGYDLNLVGFDHSNSALQASRQPRAPATIRGSCCRGERTPTLELLAQSVGSTEPACGHMIGLARAILNGPA